MFTELRETWNAIGGDPTVRCVVMTGAGDAFCSGADLASDDDTGPPIAVAMTTRLLTLNASADFATALEAEGMAQSLNFTTEDTKEAVKAFLEKRPPTFKGR